MDQQSVTLRASNPTFDEGLVFARYLDEAADGFFRFMLGRRAAHIIGKAYTQPDHSYSFQNVIFAERDELILGMVSGFTAEQHCCFSDQPLKEAAGYRALRMMAVKTLCAPLLRILSTLADGDFYLLAIAIAKKLRGEGIGSTLIDTIEDRARDAGATRLSLDVCKRTPEPLLTGLVVWGAWPMITIPQQETRDEAWIKSRHGSTVARAFAAIPAIRTDSC